MDGTRMKFALNLNYNYTRLWIGAPNLGNNVVFIVEETPIIKIKNLHNLKPLTLSFISHICQRCVPELTSAICLMDEYTCTHVFVTHVFLYDKNHNPTKRILAYGFLILDPNMPFPQFVSVN